MVVITVKHNRDLTIKCTMWEGPGNFFLWGRGDVEGVVEGKMNVEGEDER